MDMETIMKMMLQSGALEQVSGMLGVDEKGAESAIESVMPMLLRGMQGQMKNEDTKYGFLQALNDHSKQDTNDLKKAVKNVDMTDGAKIVNHLLGAEQEEIAAKAKKKSGLDTKTILKIMAIMAPILMSKMGQTAKTETAKAGSGDMMRVVGGLLDGVDAKDVVNILGMLMK
ncbi:MAG: DUF937 domain-containing protein [Clostridiales bacterium]|nr:DUF937 domain-containing protein [Clostridiales bacterium]